MWMEMETLGSVITITSCPTRGGPPWEALFYPPSLSSFCLWPVMSLPSVLFCGFNQPPSLCLFFASVIQFHECPSDRPWGEKSSVCSQSTSVGSLCGLWVSSLYLKVCVFSWFFRDWRKLVEPTEMISHQVFYAMNLNWPVLEGGTQLPKQHCCSLAVSLLTDDGKTDMRGVIKIKS